jgi:two-component system, NtrC family, nitrogen regulation response regulator GlnG
MARILLIDDDEDLRCFLKEELEGQRHVVQDMERAEQGLEVLKGAPFDLVLIDNNFPGGMSGTEFIKSLKEQGIEVPVILMTGHSTCDTAIRAINLGAFDYVVKPDTFQSLIGKLQPIIAEVLAITRPPKLVRVPTQAPPGRELELMLVGKSEVMGEVYKIIARDARDGSDDPVLIRGETGTGKGMVAHAVHTNSPRKNKPFVALNCAGFNDNLVESEWFGHEAGAFSGADKLRKGKFEYANGGTLFLDEIGDMPPNLQAKLLRALECQEVVRVGGNEPIKVNVRLVSATSLDLEARIREGKFRSDLFYRVNRVTVRLPPLRERLEDLPELATYFLAWAAAKSERHPPVLADSTLERLRAFSWPGNVRELQNVLYCAFGLCRGSEVLPSHLVFPKEESGSAALGQEGADNAVAGLRKAIAWAWNGREDKLWQSLCDLLERELLAHALAQFGGNQTQIGKRLGMCSNTVRKRLKKYDLIEETEALTP